MKYLVRLVCAVAFVTFAPKLAAQDLCGGRNDRPTTYDAASESLRSLDLAGCLGGPACPTPVCKQFTDWLTNSNGQKALELLMSIRNSAAAFGTSENLARLVARTDLWIIVVGKDAIAKSAPGEWRYDAALGQLFPETQYSIAVDSTLLVRCAESKKACGDSYDEIVEIRTDATLVSRLNGQMLRAHREALVTYVQGLDKRWEDYFRRAPVQYPWELGLNSLLYQKHERRGYNEPPSSQWILLHPALAYEYTDTASSRFQSAIALEPIGYFRGHLGGSVVVTWADRRKSESLGYGVALHWENKITAGIVRHVSSSRTSVLISPHIERLISTNAAKVRDVLTKIR